MANIEIKIKTEELRKRKLFLAVPMYGGQCLHRESIIETEDGPMPMKKLVDTKYSGKVKCYDNQGQMTYSKVTNHFSRRNDGKKWIKTEYDATHDVLMCTDDHMCLVSDNAFNPTLTYQPARENVGNYAVVDSTEFLFNQDQLGLLIGTMLGDGYLTNNISQLKLRHGHKQIEYCRHKASVLGNSRLITSKENGSYAKIPGIGYMIGSNAQTRDLRRMMYQNGVKTVKHITHMITPISLAYWYMDDGYIQYDNRNLTWKPLVALCTDSFNDSDIELLVTKLGELGVKAESFKYKKYRRIRIVDHEAWFGLIAPYIISSMEYKLPEKWRNIEKVSLNTKRLGFALRQITNISEVKGQRKYSQLYDIEVEQNHNFVANGAVVHNCFGTFARSINDLTSECQKIGIEMKQFFLFNESLITRARNYCVDEYLRSDCTHLMFIDSDIGFDPRDVIAMLAMMGDDSEYDIMCGPYPKKTISWEKVKKAVDKGFGDKNPNDLEKYVGDFVFNPKSGTSQIPLHQPVEVLEGGTGFMMIRRSIFEKYQSAYPTQTYRPDHVRSAHFDGSRMVHAFFDCVIDRGYTFDQVREQMAKLVEGGSADEVKAEFAKFMEAEKTASMRYLSEDYMFCQRVIGIGGKVWLCPWMKLSHTGTYNFSGSLMDLAQVGASATADPGELARHKQQQPQQHNQKKKKKR